MRFISSAHPTRAGSNVRLLVVINVRKRLRYNALGNVQVRRADARQGDPPHGKSFGGTTFGVPPYEIFTPHPALRDVLSGDFIT